MVVLGFNATLTAKVTSRRRWRTCVSWLSHTSTNTTFFPKPPTTFLTCFRGERRKYAGKKVHLKWVSNSQPQVMSQTHSPLRYPGGVRGRLRLDFKQTDIEKLNFLGRLLDQTQERVIEYKPHTVYGARERVHINENRHRNSSQNRTWNAFSTLPSRQL